MKAVLLTVLLGTLAAGVRVSAHHSFAADYFEEKSVTVSGEIVEFEYRSPHAWVQLLARDENGEMQKFSAEWASAPRLQRSGITAENVEARRSRDHHRCPWPQRRRSPSASEDHRAAGGWMGVARSRAATLTRPSHFRFCVTWGLGIGA